MITLKGNIAFISDSHYNNKREALYSHLKDILNNKNKYKQIDNLILMGDIFDFLCEGSKYFINSNQKTISLINQIATKMQVIYLEGNHDFNIKSLFPNLTIIPREDQPLHIKNNNTDIILAHGDIFTPTLYNLYTYTIRSQKIMSLLNYIDSKINYKISETLEIKLQNKNICKKMASFKTFANNRIKKYDNFLQTQNKNFESYTIIEGHFHQGKEHKNYINLSSLACENKAIIFNNGRLRVYNF